MTELGYNVERSLYKKKYTKFMEKTMERGKDVSIMKQIIISFRIDILLGNKVTLKNELKKNLTSSLHFTS